MTSKPVTYLSKLCSLKGKVIKPSRGGKNVYAFLGIPYAQQPQRFEYAKPVQLWNGCRDATKYGPIAVQNMSMYENLQFPLKLPNDISEQCLYLNVWTTTLNQNAKLPVMVWIHGGGFTAGWSNQYQGVTLASTCDVIFVSINYRLGAFGFMASDDSSIPGNFGFMDQIEALRWVQKYIVAFGGDPENTTIFGESAGAMSVALHVLSDESKGLFRRAIAQSGTASSNGFVTSRRKAEHELQRALNKLGYQGNKSGRLSFLKSLPAVEIVEKTGFMLFRPVIDGRHIKDTAENIYKSNSAFKVDFMMGCNSHEGALFTIGPLKVKSFINFDEAKGLVKRMLKVAFWDDVTDIESFSNEVITEYLLSRETGDLEELQKSMVELAGDVMFSIPMINTADWHSQIAPTYVYRFSHKLSVSLYPDWVRADHATEMFFALGDVYADRLPFLNDEEKELSREMMTLWTNFAKTGNPSTSGEIKWSQYTKAEQTYLEIDGPNSISTQHNILTERKLFWNELLKKYGFQRSNLKVESKL